MATPNLSLIPEVGAELCRVRLEGGSLGGYRCDIITENLSERDKALLICPSCEGIMKDGVISNSGKQVCKYCLGETEETLFDAPIRMSVEALKCNCPLSKRGCDWLGTLATVEDHLTTCGHVDVSCTGGEMEEHGKMELMSELGCGTLLCLDGMLNPRKRSYPKETVVSPSQEYSSDVFGIKRQEKKQHLDEDKIYHIEQKLNVIEKETQLKLVKMEEADMKHEEILKISESKIDTLEEDNMSLKSRIGILESQMKAKVDVKELMKFDFKDEGGFNVKWCAENIYFKSDQYRPSSLTDHFSVDGFKFSFRYTSDSRYFYIWFYPISVPDIFQLPFKARFLTQVICHQNPEQTLILKSPPIMIRETRQSEEICAIPKYTDLKEFIRADSLNLETTMFVSNN